MWMRLLWMLIFDRYRPERHYMRGPGPKWREKHRRGQRSFAGVAACSSTGDVRPA
jgi:hypothetical protein